MEMITKKAYAKINLGLDVIRKREDGYHEVKMIMQTINIYDLLTFRKAPAGTLSLSIDNPALPNNDDNLILKAARLLMELADVKEGVEITLEKHIPIAAGLAGGSSDAAATLLGLTELFQLPYTTEQLQEIGAKLGADVPFCIMGGTALCEGIGEKLTPLPAPPEATLVIAKPDLMVSTKYVYEHLKVDNLLWHPDIDAMVEALHRQDLTRMCDLMENVLETVTEIENPVITEIKKLMWGFNSLGSRMSGSGPTVFGIFDSRQSAVACYQKLSNTGLAKELFLTTFQ